MKINYDLKSALLQTDLVSIAKKISKWKTFHYLNGKVKHTNDNKIHVYNFDSYLPSYKVIEDTFNFYFNDNIELYNECIKIANSEYKRKQRLYDRIVYYLNFGKCYFITLTFSEEVLSNTTKEQRRRRVTEFLKQNYKAYVANIDYGDLHGREHYHAFVLFDKKVDFSLWYNNKYMSLINSLPVRISKDVDIKKISQYIAKLTNHAIKKTTKRNAIIYSRDKF